MSFISFTLFSICLAIMDNIQFHYYKSIFNRNGFCDYWFNPLTSWTNKYKDGNKEKGAKFFLSTTLLVFLTDGWHFFKSLSITLIVLTIVLYKPLFYLYDTIIFLLIYFVTFELFFNYILNKK